MGEEFAKIFEDSSIVNVWIGVQYANMKVLIRLWIKEETNLRLSAGRGTGSHGLGAPAGEFEQNYYG